MGTNDMMNKGSSDPSKPYFEFKRGFTSKFINNLTRTESKVKEYCNNVRQNADLAITSNNSDAHVQRREIKTLIDKLRALQSDVGILSDGITDSKNGFSSEKSFMRDKQEALNREGSTIRNDINQCKKELYCE